jgi:GT2 family glycosyltransferase
MQSRLNLSISVVVYKPNLEVLTRVLESLSTSVDAASKHFDLGVVLYIIDNSCDQTWFDRISTVVSSCFSRDSLTKCIVIDSGENGGYGKANNIAIKKSNSDFHLVMNPDVFLQLDTISNALSYMIANPDTGLLVPDVHGTENERHFLCKRNPSLFIMFLRGFGPDWLKNIFVERLKLFEMRDKNYDLEIDRVEYPTGCFMFFKAGLLRKIGGFDERFFMYLEDADIGRRILSFAKVRYVPKVKIVHQWARGTHNNLRLRWVTIESCFIYYKKWGGIFTGT